MARGGGGLRWVVVENRFPQIIAAMERQADLVVRKTAMDLEAQAKMLAPVDTGMLRASIQAFAVAPRHWAVVVGVEYGVYLEYGTRHNAPQPFMMPAKDIVWPAFQAAMARLVT